MIRRFSRLLSLATAAALVAGLSGCVVLREGGQASDTGTQETRVHTEIVQLPESIKDRGYLVIGSQLASPPMNFPAGTGYQGINVDLVNEIGAKLGVDIRWKQLPFAGLIPAVKSKQIDAAIDLIGDTSERAEVVDFSNYMNQATSPLVQRGNPHNIESAADLCGLPIAIVRGGVQLELAEEENAKCVEEGEKPIEINQFSAPGDARLSVQAGRTAAFLGNTPVMRYIAESEATRDVFEMGGEATYQLQPIGIITAKDQRDLKESIQSAIDVLRANGTIDTLLAKWKVQDLALAAPEKETGESGEDK
ncbi:transporter substrate-binding domain-containing protein [Glutamicibacter soli]|uniref:Transporter substrate-binding domain-containing protein n=1 Tax=Glutamicibacter soli TaxID=453836 RepID=A0A6L9G5Y7_9MICC|nr:ABC transporter substrate-binding protein [Glutamicibacter soli]NAZ16175.1 transporter substrate-binding domain-containing protein [Glutamicibacter soli]